MTWFMFLAIVVAIYIGLGIVIPFGFILGYSGVMRTKVQYLTTLANKKASFEGGSEEEEEDNNSKASKPKRHVHGTQTNKQQ